MIQREYKRAGKIGSVEGAGGVAEVMIELGEAASAKKMPEMGESRFMRAAIFFAGGTEICESDGVDVGELHAGDSEDTIERQKGEGVLIVRAAELFFFDGGKN